MKCSQLLSAEKLPLQTMPITDIVVCSCVLGSLSNWTIIHGVCHVVLELLRGQDDVDKPH